MAIIFENKVRTRLHAVPLVLLLCADVHEMASTVFFDLYSVSAFPAKLKIGNF